MNLGDVPAAVWTTISAIGVAIASGLITVWASRGKTKIDVQGQLNQGFTSLVDKLNSRIQSADNEMDRVAKENRDLINENAKLREELMLVRSKLAVKIRELRRLGKVCVDDN